MIIKGQLINRSLFIFYTLACCLAKKPFLSIMQVETLLVALLLLSRFSHV